MKVKDIIVEAEPEIELEPKKLKGPGIRGVNLSFPYDSTTNTYLPKKDVSRLGSGISSIALSKKSKPHEVKRITHTVRNGAGLNDDPYLNFLKVAVKHQDNPYLPRIYSVKTFLSTEGNYTYYVDLERLHSWKELSWAQWAYLFKKFFGTQIRDNREIYSKQGAAEKFAEDFKKTVHDFYKKTHGVIISKYLNDALKLISPFVENFYIDLHQENIMFRFTPYGVQPVITDPLYYN